MIIALLQIDPAAWGLGPTGTVIMLALLVTLTVINWRQRTWRSTADAAVAEMNVHKQTAERLEKDSRALRDRAAKAEAQTDLQPLMAMLATYFDQGRTRFEKAEQGLLSNTAVLTELVSEVKAQRATSEDCYRQLTAAFVAHTLEDKQAQLEATQTRLRVANALDKLEQRLSYVAVRVGVTRWEPSKASEVGA